MRRPAPGGAPPCRVYRVPRPMCRPTPNFELTFPLLYFSTFPFCLEARPEPELHHPGLVGHVLVHQRRPVERTPFVDHERVEVLAIEYVEHFEDSGDAGVRGDPELALQARVHAVDRRTVERIARDQRPVA